jgi:hypothetical protein
MERTAGDALHNLGSKFGTQLIDFTCSHRCTYW